MFVLLKCKRNIAINTSGPFNVASEKCLSKQNSYVKYFVTKLTVLNLYTDYIVRPSGVGSSHGRLNESLRGPHERVSRCMYTCIHGVLMSCVQMYVHMVYSRGPHELCPDVCTHDVLTGSS